MIPTRSAPPRSQTPLSTWPKTSGRLWLKRPSSWSSAGRLTYVSSSTRNDHRTAVLQAHMDPLPPFPYINGPLFGVSRSLGAMLASSHFPTRWLRQGKASGLVTMA